MIRVERVNLRNRINTLQSKSRDKLLKRFDDADRLPVEERDEALTSLKTEVDSMKPTENVSGKKARIEDTK